MTAHREIVHTIRHTNGDYYATLKMGYVSQYSRTDDGHTRGRQLLWWNKPLVGAEWADCPACGDRRVMGPTLHECKNKATAVRPHEPWTSKTRARLIRWLEFKATEQRLRDRPAAST